MMGEGKREISPVSIGKGIYTAIGMAETRTPASPEPLETKYKPETM
jgi:hypothetical protein